MNKPGKSSGAQDYFASKEAQELKKSIEKNLKANVHHEKAIGILKEALQLAASDPAMTPEVKELADMIVFLIEDREPFNYDFDAVIDPVVQIARVEIPSKGGKARAANDERTEILQKIEKEAINQAGKFRRHGYQAEFVREMLAKYLSTLKDDKAILKRLGELKKKGLIEKFIKK